MDPTRVRERLRAGAAGPSVFRAALADVPVEERDAWFDAVCGIEGVPDDEPELPTGCVPYLPCPVATLLDMIEQAEIGDADVFVDVGAGLGRATAFTHLLTGAACIGLEIQPGLVRAARRLATGSNLSRCTMIEGDAAELGGHIAIGTVFLLYCPFGGERLTSVLRGLEQLARTRPIRICCVDLPLPPCSWLVQLPTRSPELAVHRSTFAPGPCGGDAQAGRRRAHPTKRV